MSRFVPVGPTIPQSTNNDNIYNRSERVGSLTDGIAVLQDGRLSNLLDPLNPRDAANKQYVLDNAGGDPGLNKTWKNSVQVASTGPITLFGTQTVDSVLISTAVRVLVKDQADTTQNGIYLSSPTASWTRAIDCPLGSQASGNLVAIISGNTYVGKVLICNTINLDNTPKNYGSAINFVLYGQSTPGGSSTEVQFNNAGVLAGSPNLIWDGTNLTSTSILSNSFNPSNNTSDVNMFANLNAQLIVGSNNTSQNVSLNGYAGNIIIDKQISSVNGAINILGKNVTTATLNPAPIVIQAGSASNLSNTPGGNVTISAGASSVSTPGGSVYVNAGISNSATGSIYLNTGNVIISSPTNSTNTTTGALTILGGLGVSKTIYASSANLSILTAGTVNASYITGAFALPNAQILVGSVSGVSTPVTMSGDASLTNTGILGLSTVLSNPGSYTNANITIDGKGRITSATNGTLYPPNGANGTIQYNNNGTFNGATEWSYTNSSLFGSTASSLIVKGQSSITNLNTTNNTVSNLISNSINTTNISSTNNTITNLISNNINTTNIASTNNTVNNLLTTNFTTTNSNSTNTSIGTLNITNATVGNLNATGIITGPLALPTNQILIGSATNTSIPATISGDATLTSSGALSLSTVATPGSFVNANIVLDSKGRVTSASNGILLSPGGANATMQFNNNGAFGGATEWLYTNNTLTGTGTSKINITGQGTIANLYITNLTSGNLTSNNANITSLNATSISYSNLSGNNSTIGNLLSTIINTTNISSTNNSITNLITTSTTAGNLNVTGTITGSLSLPNGQLLIGSVSNLSSPVTMSGDATISNAGGLTLATVATPGSFTNANITIDAKGRITTATNGSSGTPGGANGTVQYNNNGTLGGLTEWSYTGGTLLGSVTGLLNLGGKGTIANLYTSNNTISNALITNNTSTNLVSTNITTTNLNATGTITGSLSLPTNQILIGSAGGISSPVLVSGDATLTSSGALTLSSVITPGSYTNANITVDAKGRVTTATNGTLITPANPTSSLQYNNSGSFGGVTEWFYSTGTLSSNTSGQLLSAGKSTISNLFANNTTIQNLQASNSTLSNLFSPSATFTNLTTTGTITGSLSLPNGQLLIGSVSNLSSPVTMSGDATISNAGGLTLATVATPGSFTNANITIDAKGRITTATNGSSGVPGGVNGAVQYNNNGALGGSAEWIYTNSSLVTTSTSSNISISGGGFLTQLSYLGITVSGGSITSNNIASLANLANTNSTITNIISTTNTTTNLYSTNHTSTNNTLSNIISTISSITNLYSTNHTSTNNTLTNLVSTGITTTNLNATGTITGTLSLPVNQILIGSPVNTSTPITISGDATLATSGTLTLSTVATPGSFTNANITIDAKGRVTSASNGSSSGVPGGANGALQYNNSGAFGGTVEWIYTNSSLLTTNTASSISLTNGTNTTLINGGNATISNMITTSTLSSLYVNTTSINSSFGTITNLVSLVSSVATLLSTNSTISTLNSTNHISTNNTLTNLVNTTGSITNLYSTNSTISTLTSTNHTSTNNTLTNLVATGITTVNLNATGTITGTLFIPSTQILIGSPTNLGTPITVSGDATLATSGTLTLSTVATPGSFTNANITIDAKGRVTTASNGPAPVVPSGANGALQYNNSGAFGGTVEWIYTNSSLLTTNTASSISLTNGTNTTLINGGNATISNMLTTSTLSSLYINTTNAFSTNATIGTLTSTNHISTNNTFTNLVNTTGSVTNLYSTNSTISTLTNTNNVSTNATVTNLVNTTGSVTNLYSTNATISTLTNTNNIITNATIGTLTNTNNVSTNATITNLVNTTGSVTNLYSTNATIGTLTNTNINNTNATLGSLVNTNSSITNLYSSAGVISLNTANTASSILLNGAIYTQLTPGNATISGTISAGTVNANAINTGPLTASSSTITNLINTTGSVTNLYSTNATIGTLTNTNINNTNATIGTLTSTNHISTNNTLTNLINTTGSVTNLYSTNATVATLTSTNNVSTNNTYTNLVTTTGSITNLYSTNSTVANMLNTTGSITTLFCTNATFGNLSCSTNSNLNIVFANQYNVYSDKTLKNISGALNSLESLTKVCSLTSMKYAYKTKPTELRIGYIAQDLENLGFNNLVQEDANHIKTVNYVELIPYITESIKELRSEINAIKTKLGMA